tara:strand:+ start:253 stop:480 length:228 start_codon:yes stop_codon:yes gene_type:complete
MGQPWPAGGNCRFAGVGMGVDFVDCSTDPDESCRTGNEHALWITMCAKFGGKPWDIMQASGWQQYLVLLARISPN